MAGSFATASSWHEAPLALTNVDRPTASSFDAIWQLHGSPSVPTAEETSRILCEYFPPIFPLDRLSKAEGFDLGSGNGRIARIIAPRVGILNCVEPSEAGIVAARRSLAGLDTIRFHQAAVDAIPLADESQDFGYSIGVLHHIPSPLDGLRACVRKLKPGAPFLLYVYHDVGFRPRWVQVSWRISNVIRKGVSRLPFGMKVAASNLLAATLYWPLSRTATLLERLGRPVEHLPLAYYRAHGWDVLKADALDRFGTPVEHRFSRDGVIKLMKDAGLQQVRVADGPPYWVASGIKS